MRFLNKRLLKTIVGVTAVIILIAAGALTIYLNSPAFREEARRYIVRVLEERTGGVVSLERFDWNLRQQRFRLDGLTIRGLEPQTDPPLLHIDSVDAGLSLRSLIRRQLDLFQLIITRPAIHVLVDQQGKTNLPTPTRRTTGAEFNFQVSIQDFQIVDGLASVNEQQVRIDFGVTNLGSNLTYSSATQVLASQLRYDGMLRRADRPSIPYSLISDLDYTRGTILAKRMEVRSGDSLITLQGRINDVLTRNIAGQLEYTGKLAVPFLNYFFVDQKFGGTADAAGRLEFSRENFSTRGSASAASVEFEDWKATNLRAQYSYNYPDKRLTLRELRTQLAGGSATGSIEVSELPGASRVSMDLDYQDIDSAALARAYPWDPKYRIYSKVNGSLKGWFEGKFARFQLDGMANFKPYAPVPAPGIVALPLEGSARYALRPGETEVHDAEVRFFSTSIRADGLIHARASNLNVSLTSSDLRDLYFIYGEANGAGSFEGVLSGPIKTPQAAGQFVLDNHKYRQWTIQHAQGNVGLDTLTEVANLHDVFVLQGQSQIKINGTSTLDGKKVDLRLDTPKLSGDDLAGFITQKLGGVFSGSAHITSLEPLNLEGDVRAAKLVFEDRLVGDVRSHVRYREPLAEFDNLSVTRNGSTLTGDFAYNLRSEDIKFTVRVASLNLDSVPEAGLPEGLKGVIQDGQFSGDGNRREPNIRGQAVVRNLELNGERFPQASVQVRSTGSIVNVVMDAGPTLNLAAQLNASGTGFPFTAQATFTRYSVAKLIGFNQGTLILTGRANLSGTLNDRSRLRGSGQISGAEAEIQQRSLKAERPFTFEFDSNQLTVSGISLNGEGTAVNIGGVIGFTPGASLNLDVTGRVDLALLASAYPEWNSSGTVTLDGRVGGSVKSPDLRGLVHFDNASFARRGVFTSLSSLNGDLFFDENRVTLNNVAGSVGGGTVQIQGSALIQGSQLQSMNVRVDTRNVRIRYPEGLRTVVGGTLVLRGDWAAPRLEGSLEIQNMAYRSEFEQFLAMLKGDDHADLESPLARLRLSIHVEGGRNISIQNELANVEARVNLDIKGTVANPGLTGHVEASGGTLQFQGTRYQITRGNIDFVDPVKIEPVVDVQAEADLRDYRVILAVTGRGDRLRFDMRSDPPLPQLEIVSLIAGGKTGEELATQSGTDVSSEQLFQGGAASILFDLLRQRVGARFGLLDRVRIDPFLLGAGNNPSARITVPLQVTKDLSITYSRDISSSSQEIIQIEYFVSKNTSVVATRDETGALGLDIKHRTRF